MQETTEKIAQEKSNWAVQQLISCGCKIKKVSVDPKDFMVIHITYSLPIR